ERCVQGVENSTSGETISNPQISPPFSPLTLFPRSPILEFDHASSTVAGAFRPPPIKSHIPISRTFMPSNHKRHAPARTANGSAAADPPPAAETNPESRPTQAPP